MAAAGSDPLLVDVGQEQAVLLVQVVAERVVPVLGLNEADETSTHRLRQGEQNQRNTRTLAVTHCFWTRSLYAPRFRASRIMSQTWELSPGHLGSP